MGTGMGTLMPTMPTWMCRAKLARGVAVAGVAGHAVAKLVRVHQLHRLGKGLYAHAAQHGAEDLFLVDRHLRRHVIKQCAAGKEAALQTRHLEAAAVHQQLGPSDTPWAM